MSDQYRGADGKMYDDEGSRALADRDYQSKTSGGGSGGGAMGGMAGAALAILIIGPIIASKIIGFLWGLLLKLGFVGRIITTLLMFVAGPFIILIPIALAVMAGGSVDFGSGNIGDILMTILTVGSVLLPSAWYFLWHYETVNVMGASEFSSKIKTFACFVWFGTIIGLIIGTISSNGAIGGVISIGSTIAGVVHYFVTTRVYAREAAENPKLRIPVVVKLGVMAALAAFVVLGSIFTDRG
jgi:hypothetical protein